MKLSIKFVCDGQKLNYSVEVGTAERAERPRPQLDMRALHTGWLRKGRKAPRAWEEGLESD